MGISSRCKVIAFLTLSFVGQSAAQNEPRRIQVTVYGGPLSNSVNGRFEDSLRDANLDAQVCLFGCLRYPVSQTRAGVLTSFRMELHTLNNGARLWVGADAVVARTGQTTGAAPLFYRVSLAHSAKTVAPMISVSTPNGLMRFGIGASIGQYRAWFDPEIASSGSENSWKQSRGGFVSEAGVTYTFGKAGRLFADLVVQYRITGNLAVGPFEFNHPLPDQPTFPVSGFTVNFSHWFGGLGIGLNL